MLISLLLSSATLIAIYMTSVFFYAQYKKDNSVVDVAWGLGFLLVTLFCMFQTGLFLPRHVLVTTLVAIWSVRLSLHIYLRNRGKGEDFRYKAWRSQWGKFFIIRSFLQIFMLQGLLVLIIVYPVILIAASHQANLCILDLVGLATWIVGFLFESIGDKQLKQFLSNPENKDKVMDKGLWRYTRHPNYFGEATMWLGIFLIALCTPYGLSSIVSPLTITLLLMFVSGVPMAEKPLENNLNYQAYKKRTSAFFPWFAKNQ